MTASKQFVDLYISEDGPGDIAFMGEPNTDTIDATSDPKVMAQRDKYNRTKALVRKRKNSREFARKLMY